MGNATCRMAIRRAKDMSTPTTTPGTTPGTTPTTTPGTTTPTTNTNTMGMATSMPNGIIGMTTDIKRTMGTKSDMVVLRSVGVRVPMMTPRSNAVTDVSITRNTSMRGKSALTAVGWSKE